MDNGAVTYACLSSSI